MIEAVMALALLLAPATPAQPIDPDLEACGRLSVPADTSIKACTALIEAGAKPPLTLSQLYLARADAYKRNHDDTRAIADYTRAIEREADKFWTVLAYANRALCYRRLGRIQDAIADEDKIIGLAPDFAGGYAQRGDDYVLAARCDEAIADYTRAIQLTPELSFSYRGRAQAWHLKGEDAKALPDADKAIALDSRPLPRVDARGKPVGPSVSPDLAKDYVTRAQIWERLDRPDKAITDYRAALKINPTFAEAQAEAQNGLRRLGAKP